MEQSGDLGWKLVVLGHVAREDGLSGQHLQKATESAQKRDVARFAIFLRFPAAELGQHLDFGPVEGHPQVVEQARRDPASGD